MKTPFYQLQTSSIDFDLWGSNFNKKPLVISCFFEEKKLLDFFEFLNCPKKMLFHSSKQDVTNHFSIIGVRPCDFFFVKENHVYSKIGTHESNSPTKELKCVIDSWESPPLPDSLASLPLLGGALGFFSYEASRFFSPMKFKNLERNEDSFFDLAFWFFDELFVYDHSNKTMYLCASSADFDEATFRLDSLKADFEGFCFNGEERLKKKALSKLLGSNFTHEAYLNAIESCRNYIECGHSYQINLAQRFSFLSNKAPWEIYKDLVRINPVSFGAYFSIEDFHVICGSPELLVRKRNRKLYARPIAGTRRLGSTSENEKFLKELLEDTKEISEHAMLVDLVRNDLSRISVPGTVKIDHYSKIIRYSHVMHIESDLSSMVEENCHPLDILAAMFPGGTVTGVPKLRTMEIIDELEKTERNIYTGSIGYISYSKDLDFNIVIRSLLFKDGRLSTHVGGGLTYDCVPEREYKETMNKVRSQLLALELEECL